MRPVPTQRDGSQPSAPASFPASTGTSDVLWKIIPLLFALLGFAATYGVLKAEVAHNTTAISSMRTESHELDRDLRTTLGNIQLNIARICAKTEARCVE